MITAEMTFARTDGGARYRLGIEGHAGYAEAGKDIVCASASMLFYALAETLRADGIHAEVKEEPGSAAIEAETGKGYEAVTAYHYFTLIRRGFMALARDYPEYVKFIIKILLG